MFEFLCYLNESRKSKTPVTLEECIRETKDMRENMSESRIDKTLENTFPASDPPAWY